MTKLAIRVSSFFIFIIFARCAADAMIYLHENGLTYLSASALFGAVTGLYLFGLMIINGEFPE